MRWAITACALLAGCDLFFPLADPSFQPPETPTVVGTAIVRNAQLQGGVPVTIDTPGEDVQIRVRFSNGERANVAVQPDGTFEFVRPTNDYALEYAFGGVVRELQETAPTLAIVIRFAGRLDLEQLTNPVNITFPSSPVNVSGYVATVGQYTRTLLKTNHALDWQSATLAGGLDVGLFRSSREDQMFFLQYAAPFVVGQTAIIGSAQVPAFEMTSGQSIDHSLLAVTPANENGCVRMTSQLEGLGSRFEQMIAADPRFLPATRGWNIGVLPAPLKTGTAGILSLVAGSVTNLDFVDDAPYHDPFSNHELLIGIGVSSSRSVITESATVPIGAGAVVFFEGPARGPCGASPLLTGDVSFPSDIRLDGLPLITDKQPVNRDGELRVTWASESIPFDFFEVQLTEMTSLGAVVVRQYRTRESQITIGKDVLLEGHSYVIGVASVTGFPNARTGDYDTLSYPSGSALTPSAVFEAI